MKRHALLAMTVLLSLGLLVAALPPSPASLAAPAATPLYVRSGGTQDCRSWANACELQTALDAAAAGDQIWVAAGTYTPVQESSPTDPRSATLQLQPGVALYGGFPAAGSPGFDDRDWVGNLTILSGDIDDNDLTDPSGVITDTDHIEGNNSNHVVTGSGVTETAVLDGFTITGGNAPAGSPSGGGMVNLEGSPTLVNLTFRGNTAAEHGGGMYNDNSNPALTNVTFSSNSANCGGGMGNRYGSSPELTDVTFSGNTAAEHGGGMYNDNSKPTLTNCQFTNNLADTDSFGTGNGGGLYNINNSSPVLSGTHFDTNTAAYGGGMCNEESSNPALSDVVFASNTATEVGGGMANRTSSSPALTNVVFASNTATETGGGMANRTSNPALVNLTFSGNTARYGGGMHNEYSSPTLANCILWGNTATSGGDQISNSESAPNVSFSDIEGGYLGTGNISVDPLFVDPDNGDLHLAPGSPCIDAGNNAAPNLPAHDFEGDSRIIDGNRDGSAIVDMGVDEVRLRVYLPLVLRDPVTGIAAGAAN